MRILTRMFCSQQVERKQAWIQSFSGEALASQRAGRRKRTHSTPELLKRHDHAEIGRREPNLELWWRAMAAWNRRRWIGIAIIALAIALIAFTRPFSLEGLSIALITAGFVVIGSERFQAFWSRLQTDRRIYLILAAVLALWCLNFFTDPQHYHRVSTASLETGFVIAFFGLYWRFSKAMDALWLRLRRR
jgi:hypothetical protein